MCCCGGGISTATSLQHTQRRSARRILQRLREPVELGGRTLYVGASIGIALTGDNRSSIVNRLPARIRSFGETAHPAQCLVSLDACGTPLLALFMADAGAAGLP